MSETSKPFDEFDHPEPEFGDQRRGSYSFWIRSALRGLSFGALWVALLTMGYLMFRRALPLIMDHPPAASFKSAVPLIAIGISYLFLIVTLQRTPGQRVVGILVGLAFTLWGVEQYLSDPVLISIADDIVVLVFVADLTIVIRQNFGGLKSERRIRQANFPVIKTIESFNFAAQLSIDEAQVRGLLKGEYLERRENIVIVGNGGTGKTHLARSLGYEACQLGKRVSFTTASALVSQLVEHHGRKSLRRFLGGLGKWDLLIVDEIGYARFSEAEAQLLFEVFSGAYERMSVIITTAIPLDEWAELFGDERLTKAVTMRLTERAHVLETSGEAYLKSRVKAVASPRFKAC